MSGGTSPPTATTTGRSHCVGDDVTYLVFSDDIAWCRESLGLERAEFVDVDHGTSLA